MTYDDTDPDDDGTVEADVDNQSISTDQESIGNRKVVSPQSHSLADIVSDLKNGKDLFLAPGSYSVDAANLPHTITDSDVSEFDLRGHPGAVIDATGIDFSTQGSSLLEINGTASSSTGITADVSVGDDDITVSDSSGFSTGDLVRLSDSATFTGSVTKDELFIADGVPDATSVNVADGAAMSHASADSPTLEVLSAVTPRIEGVTLDLGGADTNTQNPIRVLMADGGSIDLTYLNDASSNILNTTELKNCYGTRFSPRSEFVDDGNTNATAQVGAACRHVTVRDVYSEQGRAVELGEGTASGPAIGTTITGGSFRSGEIKENAGTIRTTVEGVTAIESDATAAAFRLRDGTYRDLEVLGADNDGILVKAGATVSNAHCENVDGNPFSVGGSGDPVTINGPSVEASLRALVTESPAPPVYINNPTFIDAPIRATSGGTKVVVDGGYIEGDTVSGAGCPVTILKNVELNGAGTSNALYQDLQSNTKSFVVMRGCEVYDAWGAIRIQNATTVRVEDTAVPDGETPLDNYIIRAEESNGSDTVTRAIISGVDARGTGNSNGFDLAGATDVIWGEDVLDRNGENPKMNPANLSGSTGPYDGYTRVDDGTNAGNRGVVCVWDDTNSVWVPQDGSAEFT